MLPRMRGRLLILVGVLAVLVAVGGLALWRWNDHRSEADGKRHQFELQVFRDCVQRDGTLDQACFDRSMTFYDRYLTD